MFLSHHIRDLLHNDVLLLRYCRCAAADGQAGKLVSCSAQSSQMGSVCDCRVINVNKYVLVCASGRVFMHLFQSTGCFQ